MGNASTQQSQASLTPSNGMVFLSNAISSNKSSFRLCLCHLSSFLASLVDLENVKCYVSLALPLVNYLERDCSLLVDASVMCMLLDCMTCQHTLRLQP